MGSIGDCFDNSMAESFFGTLQLELLDRHHWETRDQLASAIFGYLDAFYNPRRRHSSSGNLSPAEFESRHTVSGDAAWSRQPTCSAERGNLRNAPISFWGAGRWKDASRSAASGDQMGKEK